MKINKIAQAIKELTYDEITELAGELAAHFDEPPQMEDTRDALNCWSDARLD